MTRNDEHLLEDVRLVRLDEAGSETDTIDASSALYRIEDKQLEFRDDVVIQLSQGTRIYADRADADLDREIVTIREKFRFVQGSVIGAGQHLVYAITPRRLTILSGLDLEFDTSGQKGKASALSGVYDMPEGIIRLRDAARVDLVEYQLSASEIDLKVTGQSRLDRLSALGKAALEIGEARRFTGQRIEMVVPPEPELPGSLVVFGDRPSPSAMRVEAASYSESLEGGLNELQADRIDAPYQQVASEKGTGIVLSFLRGSGDTSFRSEPANLSNGSAERFRADFSGNGAGIARLRLEGNAYLRSEPKPGGAAGQDRDELWCRRLDLRFEEAGVPEYCLAEGPVRLLHSGATTTREITAGGNTTITYSDGLPELLQATGGCRLKSDRDTQHGTMTAPSFRLRFLEGQPSQGVAEGGTVLTFQNPDEEVLATSAKLITDFQSGAPAQAAFSGDFKLNRKDRGGALKVAGDEGRYDLLTADLSIAGKNRPEMTLESGTATFRTRAEELRLSRGKESISADGNVESASEGTGGISVITAQHMESSTTTGWIRYTGRPRVVQDENLVNAAEIRVNRAEGALEAEGGVDSVWTDHQKAEAKQFQVRSERMQILTSENRAVYEGEVVLEAEGLLLKAPRLEAYFATAPAKGVERIEASGGVDIREQGRHWETEKAVYYRATDRVIAVK